MSLRRSRRTDHSDGSTDSGSPGHTCTSNIEERRNCTIKFIDTYIGCGVFARRPFQKGEFLLEYKGVQTLSSSSQDIEEDGLKYFFHHNGQTYYIDPSNTDAMGKMVNDGLGKRANCKMRKILRKQLPVLCLFATKVIRTGDELRYDYGVRNLPWRKVSTVNLCITIVHVHEKKLSICPISGFSTDQLK
ncbi:N-lysine methyltransferase KMT5A-A-like [Pecten maximus]|uniref:N-lysine methyltransferase KMT5A-A-like n=1 Tax=Pecten maximus TaxID=6579 RepID=UPI0014584DA4|nr:N-lysine methyltransferase KMT5A-A-like [Pecten maximus]